MSKEHRSQLKGNSGDQTKDNFSNKIKNDSKEL